MRNSASLGRGHALNGLFLSNARINAPRSVLLAVREFLRRLLPIVRISEGLRLRRWDGMSGA
jgi:hypothetical protein